MFIEKVRDIVGLYLNPPDKALVWCADEKTQIQVACISVHCAGDDVRGVGNHTDEITHARTILSGTAERKFPCHFSQLLQAQAPPKFRKQENIHSKKYGCDPFSRGYAAVLCANTPTASGSVCANRRSGCN